MTGDGNDSDDGRSDGVPVAETLDELLASDDSGLCAGLLDVLALLSDVGAARWVLHRAGDLALAAAPGGYGCHQVFASEVIDAALKELAEAGLLTIEKAAFDDAGDGYDDDVDVADGESRGFEDTGEAGDAGDEGAGEADDLDDGDPDGPEAEDKDQEEDYLDDSAFDTVTVAPGTARIIIGRHVAAGTLAELGDRACGLLEEAARSSAGIDSELLTDGMTACWDHLRPYLGPADSELVKDLLTMRTYGLYSLVLYPDASETGPIEFGEKLVADYEQALGPGHPDAWEARRNMAHAYERACRDDEAIDTFARLRTDKERVLPADDRGILDSRDDLALAHMNAGRYPEAVNQYTQLLADYELVVGPRDSLTLSVRGALGEAYLEVGRIAEGTELMEAAADGLAAIFGPDSPEVTRFRESIDEGRTRRRMAL
jgi:tetratricopeptide (TPR) repeat protein